ncbi:ANTAR domain-containing protein [Jatrophihabitans sp. DSM 45814]
MVAVASTMHHLVSSADPAVVFSSLAKLSVPTFSDACVITIQENAGSPYRIAYPHVEAGADQLARTTSASPANERRLNTRTQSSAGDAPQYEALIVHAWQNYVPNAAEVAIARLMADRAVAVVREQRLATKAARAQEIMVSLERALETSRHIGVAIGIVMATRNLSTDAAFDLLREVSQRTHQKLREIADDIVARGSLV